MIALPESEIRERIAAYVGPERVPRRIRIVRDTTEFFSIDYDDVLVLGDRAFFVRSYEREGRFGIDDEPKYWVRRAIDLTDGGAKVLKMVFHERFMVNFGDFQYECVRSPAKEARILDIVRGHPRFMQGYSVPDAAGNIIRVLDRIPGGTFADHIERLAGAHEAYYHSFLRGVLSEFLELARAIGFLHERGESHGDIRRDHAILDARSSLARWIDFDYRCVCRENPRGYDLAGLGNLLLFACGRGDVTLHGLGRGGHPALDALTQDDMGIIFQNRVANLAKVYPYISPALNAVLARFSQRAEVFYDSVAQLVEDVAEARETLT
jgi:hypothetical protein